MPDSSIQWVRTAPRSAKVAFLQGLFDRAAVVNAKSKAVWVPVLPSYLNDVIGLLKDVGASPYVVGTEPIMVAVDVEKAAHVPLFNPLIKSKKYRQVSSLASLKMT